MLLYGADKEVREWVSFQLFGNPYEYDEKVTAIGVTREKKIIAGVVYTNYHPALSIEMSIASVDKTWCTMHNMKAFFKYPFIDLGVKRVQTLCSAKDKGVCMFNKRIGFKLEGIHKEAWFSGGDTLSWGMLKDNCRWIRGLV